MIKLPVAFKQKIPGQDTFARLAFFKRQEVNTVCISAHCPNLTRCFGAGCATFMLLGDTCTRTCLFCAVKKNQGPLPVDGNEPYRIANVARSLGLSYIVITSVTRDDLPDAGAGQFAKTSGILRRVLPGAKIELLIPDFQGKTELLEKVIEGGPEVIGHNMETVERLYPEVRPQADYNISLNILKNIKRFNSAVFTKSSLMLGMGEKEPEVTEVFKDLRAAGCDILTLGQYLRPSPEHYPVKEFISPGQFDFYRDAAYAVGFKAVLAGPLVRSSSQAEKIYLGIRGMLCTI